MHAKREAAGHQQTKITHIPSESGRVHERMDLMEAAITIAPTTPETAVSRIKQSLNGIGFQKTSQQIGNPIKSQNLLDSFGAPHEYKDSVGRTRGCSIPDEVGVILIRRPVYDLAWGKVPMFSFCLGLARTKHDPKSGATPKYWEKETGPPHSSRPTSEWAPANEAKYPMPWSHRNEFDGYNATCWAHYHLLFPSKRPPVLAVSAFQNEILRMDDQCRREYGRLHAKANSRWRSYYDRIMADYDTNPQMEMNYAFAYPNRALLLPVIGLKMANDLGAGEYQMVSTAGYGGSHDSIYTQACELLSKCKTKIPVTYPRAISQTYKLSRNWGW